MLGKIRASVLIYAESVPQPHVHRILRMELKCRRDMTNCSINPLLMILCMGYGVFEGGLLVARFPALGFFGVE